MSVTWREKVCRKKLNRSKQSRDRETQVLMSVFESLYLALPETHRLCKNIGLCNHIIQ